MRRAVGFDGWCWARLDLRCQLPAHGWLAEVADVLMRAWALSPRERQVAAAIVSGQGTTETARALRISEHTARHHVKAVFAKVGVHSRDHLRDVLTDGLR